MIKINLLPHELRPIQRTPLPHIASLLVLGVVLVFMANVFLDLNGQLNQVNAEVKKSTDALQELGDVVAEHNELTEQKKRLQEKIGTIQSILKDRTIWSGHFCELTKLTPENIWFKRVRLTTRKFAEEVPELDAKGNAVIDKKTNKPKMKKEQRDKFILEVSGYAVDDATGMSSTSTLATNTTKADAPFAETFTLFTSKITDTEFNGFPVREFMFEYLVSTNR